MSSPEVSPATAHELPAARLVEVGVYPTFAVGSEHGLVVLAMGLPYWLEPGGDGFRLLVDAPGETAVRAQLARFDRESVGWPPPPEPPGRAVEPADLLGALLWTVAIFGVFWAAQRWPEMETTGRLDARAVVASGQWWRAATALLLHADAAHLASNALCGVFVFTAVAATLGRARGWLLILAGGVLGNLASAAAQYPESYHSVGASTAIFAGVGLLTGHAVRRVARHAARRRWRALLVPLGAGGSVLALYGAGGLRVDVGAHLCGFLAGCALGLTQRASLSAGPAPG